jgi:hypothetical protein
MRRFNDRWCQGAIGEPTLYFLIVDTAILAGLIATVSTHY